MDDNLEKVYADKKAWSDYGGETEDETIGVYGRCFCGRYLKKGELLMNRMGNVKLKNWICNKCGEIEPYWDRDC